MTTAEEMPADKAGVLARLEELGVVAVLRGPSPELTVQMVDALVAGGITGIEITYTTPDAAGVVRTLAGRYGEQILLGMGTLTQPAQAREAADAGARFLVSPHTADDLTPAMAATGLVTMAGAITPSEVVRARSLGADVVKLFPGSLVGPGYVKALRGPFPDLPLIPTGGVEVDNLAAWFAAGVIAVGAGSSLCPTSWAQEGRFAAITSRAQEFAAAVTAARRG